MAGGLTQRDYIYGFLEFWVATFTLPGEVSKLRFVHSWEVRTMGFLGR